ncbi:MAG: glycine cleavage system protein H [Pirellulaceae bacterium]|nr:MAG: glycine cleavage system protein H [Pirellulaceae bacterium]
MSADPLVFMMGQYAAEFPRDRRYAKNHMWGQQRTAGIVRFGLSAYAVRLLQDVYFFDLQIAEGMQLSSKQEIGSIESKKAESSLYAPVAGRVTAVNESLLDDPTAINLDKYGAGWMFELECVAEQLLSPEEYLKHLDSAWEVAQRTIKGQANA